MCPDAESGYIHRVVRAIVDAFRALAASIRWRGASRRALQVVGAIALVLIITAGLFVGVLGVLTMFTFNR
jgi:hypothetical protein